MLTGKPTDKRLLGRPWSRWEDNIRINLKEVSVNEAGMIRLRVDIF